MKRSLILGAALLASVSSAEAIECASGLPAVRSGHWSYRIIDGRGAGTKAKLVSEVDVALAAKSLSNAQAKMPFATARISLTLRTALAVGLHSARTTALNLVGELCLKQDQRAL